MLALTVVYECPGCGERSLGRRGPDRNLLCKSLGRCPCCEEAVAVEELG